MKTLLKNALRKTSMKGEESWYEYYRTPCPICGSQGWCMVNESQTQVICGRTESNTKVGQAGYLHDLKNDQTRKYSFSKIASIKQHKKRNDYYLSVIFNALLKQLELRREHVLDLTGPNRRLSSDAVTIRGYKSFPEDPRKITKQIIKVFGNVPSKLFGVPGFFTKTDNNADSYITLSGRKDSFLIPQRNEYNQIVGFQYRIDNPKTYCVIKEAGVGFKAEILEQPNTVKVILTNEKATLPLYEGELQLKKEYTFTYGNKQVGKVKLNKESKYMWISSSNLENGTGAGPLPLHVAVPSSELLTWKTGELLERDCVWITEGALKSDIAADNLDELLTDEEKTIYGTTVVAIPGIKTWKMLLPHLRNMKVRKAILALDMDITTNVDVQKAILEITKELTKENIELYFASWDIEIAKGLDDLLLQDYIPNIQRISPKSN